MFGNDAGQATWIAACESRLLPAAQNTESTAAGVFQILEGTWADAQRLNPDLPGWHMRYEPASNVEAAQTLYRAYGWAPWAASKACWSDETLS